MSSKTILGPNKKGENVIGTREFESWILASMYGLKLALLPWMGDVEKL